MTERKRAPKRLPGWVFGGLFGCVVVMGWMGWNSPNADQRLNKVFGGEPNLRCVRDADRVFSTRLGPSPGVQHPVRIEDYVAVAEPIAVPAGLSQRLRKLLTLPSSFDLSDEKHTCLPRYGYRLRFTREQESLEAWICLECGLVEFVRDGKGVGGGFFTPIENDLRSISVELFPEDGAIADGN